MQGKQGVELSMNLIIVAVLGLLVLVVMVYLISSGTITLNEGMRCNKEGGRCVSECDPATHDSWETDDKGRTLCRQELICCSLAPQE